VRKKKALKKLEAFREQLNRPCFRNPPYYLPSKTIHIDVLDWLISVYKGPYPTTMSPEEMLEHIIKNRIWTPEQKLVWIEMLYFWINYERIEGF